MSEKKSAGGGRAAAIQQCKAWLERGAFYAKEGGKKKGKKAPKRAVFNSEAFEFVGTEDNVTLRAAKEVAAGTTVIAVAKDLCMHPRSATVDEARAAQVAEASKRLRSKCRFRTPLVDATDGGRLDLILLLAMELLASDQSVWSPYLQTLPSLEATQVPSLWGLDPEAGPAPSPAPPSPALDWLQHTSLSLHISRDVEDLRTALRAAAEGSTEEGTWVQELLGAPSVAAGRRAFLHAAALVSSRMFSGAGLAPVIDLFNGCPEGDPTGNVTIQFVRIGEGVEAVAAVTKRDVAAGEDFVLEYGALSAPAYLYKYGWVPGDPAKPPSTAHDVAVLSARAVFEGLAEAQRAALARCFEFDFRFPAAADEAGARSPFAATAAAAADGAISQLLAQVAFAAGHADEGALRAAMQAPMDMHRVAATVSGWIASRVALLTQQATACLQVGADARALQAARVCAGEASVLLRWMGGLQKKHKLDPAAFKDAVKANLAVITALRAAAPK